MSNIWRIFRDDIRYARSNIVSLLVILGLCLVPVMYAWFNIAGSWDPYSNTGELKVAVANEDDGYESALMPVRVNVGERVTSALHSNTDYGWTFVNKDDALDGVQSGEYYAAVVIPDDFSEKLMTTFSSDAQQASIDYYVNMKENPIAPVLVTEGGAEVIQDIQTKFAIAVDDMVLGLASDLSKFATSGSVENFGEELVSSLDGVADTLDATADDVRSFMRLTDATSSLTEAVAKSLADPDDEKASTQSKETSDADDAENKGENFFTELTKNLDEAISSASSAVSSIQSAVKKAKDAGELASVGDEAASKLASDVAELSSSVDAITRNADDVAKKLTEATKSIADSSDSLSSDLDDARKDLGTAANRLGASASKLRQFKEDVINAVGEGDFSKVASIVGGDTNHLAQWLAAPVKIERHAMYPVANYGSSMAPFYSILSIWVGAVVLVAIMKTSVSQGRIRRYEEEGGRPVKNYELYLGRYGVFAVLNILQATVVCLGDVFFLGVQCVHPLLFLVACWVCAIVFSNIVYTFAVSFGEIGKALCIIMLVMQVAGSGGEYPIQMMGGFFQAVYPFLPFTHGIRAMQASIAGVYGMEFLTSLGLLAAFLAPSLLLGLAIRRPVIRFMTFFNAKLEETGLM